MQKSIATSLFLLCAFCAQANNYTVKSPDGKLVVNVSCEEGKASYTVDYEGKQMLTRIKKAHVEKDFVEASIGFLNEKKDSISFMSVKLERKLRFPLLKACRTLHRRKVQQS